MTASELAREAGVSRTTIFRIERTGKSINYSTAMSLLGVLGERLHRTILISDVEGLRVQ